MVSNNDYVTFKNPHAERIAVILAGGDGVRMRELTKRITGCEIPKQFCPMLSEDTLLTVTQKRVALKFTAENIFYSLIQTHEDLYKPLLENAGKRNKIIQSQNKGTAPAILYSLMRLSKINPQASVAFFPSDHYVSDDEAFMNQVDKAFLAVAKKTEAVVLLGIEPLAPNISFDWVEPSEEVYDESAADLQKINRFWEQPTAEQAAQLMNNGGLWNSFVIVGKVKSLLAVFREKLPALYALFCAGGVTFGTSAEKFTVNAIYKMISKKSFSYDVLEKCRKNLYVLRSKGFAWSDLGDPQEVLHQMMELGLKNRVFPMAV